MLILSLLGLALVDALNPFSIAAMVLLLATDRPIARGTVFIAGTLAVYVLLGILLVEGWATAISTLSALDPQLGDRRWHGQCWDPLRLTGHPFIAPR